MLGESSPAFIKFRSVVGSYDDHGVFLQAAPRQVIQHRPDQAVDKMYRSSIVREFLCQRPFSIGGELNRGNPRGKLMALVES